MMILFEAEISDASGTVLGDGPISSILSFTVEERISQNGDFSFTIPANEPKAGLIEARRRVTFYVYEPAADAESGYLRRLYAEGIIKSTVRSVGVDGIGLITVAGSGMAQELADDSITLDLSEGGAGTLTGPSQVLALFPGWRIDPEGLAQTETRFYGKLAGESGLEALVMIAEKLGESFTFLPGRRVRWNGSRIRPSGVRALAGGSEREGAEPLTIRLRSLQETASTDEVLTRLVPYGSGDGEARLTLAAATWTAPAGWRIDRARNEIINEGLEARIGRIRRTMSFSDIAPVENTDADLQAAANQLAASAFAYMKQRQSAQRQFSSEVAGLRDGTLELGESIRIDYDAVSEDRSVFAVHEDFVVIGRTREVTAPGVFTPRLEVSTVAEWIANDAQILARTIRRQTAAQAHPQLSANCWMMGFRVRLDRGHSGRMDFWLGGETVTVNEATLFFRILPLESSIKSIGGKQTTSGPSSSSTSAVDGGAAVTSGPSSRETSESAKDTIVGQGLAGANTIHIGQQGVAGETDPGAASWNHKHASGSLHVPEIYVALPDHQHWITLQGHTHRMDHTHEVTIPSHSHGMNHTHEFTANIKTEYGLFRNSAAKTLGIEELTIRVNGGKDIRVAAVSESGSWFRLDLTPEITSAIFRPKREANAIVFATEVEGKNCMIDAQLRVRSVIQAIAYL